MSSTPRRPGTIDNPFALPGAAGDALGALLVPVTVAYAPAVIGAMAGLVVRLRRSHGVERLQLKWVAYVGSLMLSALLLAAVSLAFRSPTVDPVGTIGWGAFLLLVAVRPAGGGGRIDPPPPALRHRRRHQPHAGLRRADGDARRHVPRARAAGRADGRASRTWRSRSPRWRSRRCSARRVAHPGGGRPALLPPPLRRRADAGGVRRCGCATSSTSTRCAARSRAWWGRRCSRRTSRCG